MNTYLFLFTVSPVQSYITQARKARDLFAGSRILSDLTQCGMDWVAQNKPEAEFIFPAKEIPSKPNRFLCILPFADDAAATLFGNQLTDAVHQHWMTLAGDVFSRHTKGAPLPEGYTQQAASHPDIQWLLMPYQHDSYTADYALLEKTMGEIKAYRHFTQLEETGRKCSLCGERNALIVHSSKQIKPANSAFIQADAYNCARNKALASLISEGEGLCAVCFMKRAGKQDRKEFSSTAEIATLSTITALQNNEKFNTLVRQYTSLFGEDFDAQLFYPENLTTTYFGKQGLTDHLPNLDEMKKLLKKLTREAKDAGAPMMKYYAVMMFDGDNMGQWLTGELLNPAVKKDLKEFHQAISRALGIFAGKAYEVVDGKGRGAIIYAGGEDFLGFISLPHLFSVMAELRHLFDQTINSELTRWLPEGKKVTFSAGTVITHYKNPLSEVLTRVRATEKSAKSIDRQKNAFSIAVMKHSGEIHQATFRWGAGESMTRTLQLANTLVAALQTEQFSGTFIDSIEREFTRLIDQNGLCSLSAAMAQQEFSRLIERSCMIPPQSGIDKKSAIATLTDAVTTLYQESPREMISFLSIIDFMVRKMKGAE